MPKSDLGNKFDVPEAAPPPDEGNDAPKDEPNMLIIYPFFFVGSVTQCYAAVRRGAAWVMLLTGYFAVINVFGYGVAALWW